MAKEGAEAADGLDESQSHRDARIKMLWDRLGPSGANELDEKALQKGFQKIDHRMLAEMNYYRPVLTLVLL